jgi:hypothetical protein
MGGAGSAKNDPLSGVRVVGVAAGDRHTVLCTSDGELYRWDAAGGDDEAADFKEDWSWGKRADQDEDIPGEFVSDYSMFPTIRKVVVSSSGDHCYGETVAAVAAGGTRTAVLPGKCSSINRELNWSSILSPSVSLRVPGNEAEAAVALAILLPPTEASASMRYRCFVAAQSPGLAAWVHAFDSQSTNQPYQQQECATADWDSDSNGAATWVVHTNVVGVAAQTANLQLHVTLHSAATLPPAQGGAAVATPSTLLHPSLGLTRLLQRHEDLPSDIDGGNASVLAPVLAMSLLSLMSSDGTATGPSENVWSGRKRLHGIETEGGKTTSVISQAISCAQKQLQGCWGMSQRGGDEANCVARFTTKSRAGTRHGWQFRAIASATAAQVPAAAPGPPAASAVFDPDSSVLAPAECVCVQVDVPITLLGAEIYGAAEVAKCDPDEDPLAIVEEVKVKSGARRLPPAPAQATRAHQAAPAAIPAAAVAEDPPNGPVPEDLLHFRGTLTVRQGQDAASGEVLASAIFDFKADRSRVYFDNPVIFQLFRPCCTLRFV